MSDLFLPLLPFFSTLSALSALAAYLVGSIGLYQMAENTGVKNPWMAWVPIGRDYLLGLLADRCSSQVYRRPGWLRLWLTVLRAGSYPIVYLCLLVMFVQVTFSVSWDSWALPFLAALATIFGVLAAVKVVYLTAYYRALLDFEPSRAGLYTLAALLGFGCVPLFVCRNNVPVGVAGRQQPQQPRYQAQNLFGPGSMDY